MAKNVLNASTGGMYNSVVIHLIASRDPISFWSSIYSCGHIHTNIQARLMSVKTETMGCRTKRNIQHLNKFSMGCFIFTTVSLWKAAARKQFKFWSSDVRWPR